MENILEFQYKHAFDVGKKFITSLKEKEALFILDKNMNVRVIFYYKENTYFISDSFNIPGIEYINKKESLTILCQDISLKFEGTDYLRLSKLITNIDNIVHRYLINSFVILVNRFDNLVIQAKSLEVYNELIITTDRFEKLSCNEFGELLYTDTNIIERIKDINKIKDKDDILKEIYKNEEYFPVNKGCKYQPLPLELFDYNNLSVVFSYISCDQVIDYNFIELQNISYGNKEDMYILFKDFIKILNESDDIMEDIRLSIVDLYSYYLYKSTITNNLLN